MNFISIGPKCNTRYQINKYITQHETLFFDWLSTDMATVILVLQSENLDYIFTHDNIITVEKFNNRPKILVKSLPYCVSIHDLPNNFNTKDIDNFIDKYKRRHKRIIGFINSNTKQCFIRYGKIETTEKQLFIETILKINPNCNFTLVSININQPSYKINTDKHFLEINLTYCSTNTDCNDWTTSFLNWKHIFEIITKFS